eukprot:3017441-Rhodomonas_salina.1
MSSRTRPPSHSARGLSTEREETVSIREIVGRNAGKGVGGVLGFCKEIRPQMGCAAKALGKKRVSVRQKRVRLRQKRISLRQKRISLRQKRVSLRQKRVKFRRARPLFDTAPHTMPPGSSIRYLSTGHRLGSA